MAAHEATGPVRGLYRYPLKGLGAEALEAVRLRPGDAVPLDRAYAIEAGGGRFDPQAPRPLPKTNFLMLMRHPRLAALETVFDAATHELTIRQGGRRVVAGRLTTAAGREAVERFLARYMGPELTGPPRIVSADGHSFSDVADRCLHIVNLASVRALERVTGERIDPLRFRANVYVELDEPWAEFAWLRREITVGEARLWVFARTERCAAINVAPGTGQRDMALPTALRGAFGHVDMGVYASVVGGAMVRVGARVGGAAAW